MACMVLGNQGELKLSPQEYKVMCHLRAGYTVQQTANAMNIAYKTAYSYYDHVKNKLGTDTQEETILQFSVLYNSTMGFAFAVLKGCLEEENYLLLRDFIRREFTGYLGEFPQHITAILSLGTWLWVTIYAILIDSGIAYAATPTPVPAGTPFVTPTPVPDFANVGTGLVVLTGILPVLGYAVAFAVAIALGYVVIRAFQHASRYFFDFGGRR